MDPIWPEWIADVSTYAENGMICFCPYEAETDTIVWGMNLVADKPPGKIAFVVHSDGQSAVEQWCAAHKDILDDWEGAQK